KVLPAKRRADRAGALTDRENEVLQAMARGLTNAEIAAELIVGAATVKTHVGSIFTKLAVRDRAGAIVYAFQHGLVDPQADT
ncbi:MAG: LuxR C-terminal-related transcriptional regulator, partial [Actinomycetota bacterium]